MNRLINKFLMQKELKANFVIALIIALVLTMYTSIITSMYDPEMSSGLEAMMNTMPEIFEAFGMNSPTDSLIEFMINYLYGMLYIVFPLILIMILVNRMLIRYIDRGSIAYILATPNSRNRIINTIIMTLFTILIILLIYLSTLQLLLSRFIADEVLNITDISKINIGLLGLWVLMLSICFLSACIFTSSGKALWVGGGINILFILIQMISQVGDKFENLKYATIMTLYDPIKIVSCDSDYWYCVVVMYLAAILLLLLGKNIFKKRDLSV